MKVISSMVKKLGYFLAGTAFLVIILMGVSRMLTPMLDNYRPEIEKKASELLGVPVKISHVAVTWYQYQPGVSLKGVTFINKKTNLSVVEVKKIIVFFSIPKSIWQRRAIPSGIVLSGTDLNIMQTKAGEFVVQGLPEIGGQPLQGEAQFADVVGFLSEQPRLVLRNVDVHYTGHTGQKYFITLFNLSFKNDGSHHAILGKAILHQDLATDATVAIEWEGDKFDLATIKAKIYVYISGFSFAQWLKKHSMNGFSVSEGVGSAKIWSTWENGAFTRFQTMLQLFGIKLHSSVDKSVREIHRLSGNFGWKRVGNQQIIAGDDIMLDLSSRLWPVTSFYFAYEQDAEGKIIPKTANIGYVDLEDAQRFLFTVPAITSAIDTKQVVNLKVIGALQNAAIVFGKDWHDINQNSVTTNLRNVSFSPWKKDMPGVKNLTGKVSWDGKVGRLTLQSNQVEIRYDSLFLNELNLTQLTGDVKWQRDANKIWLLSIPRLQILNSDAVANIEGDLSIQLDGSVVTDLKGNFSLQKASHVSKYLPLKIFDAGLVKWLREAFLAGDLKSGDFVLKGNLKDFPFDHHEGTFLISGLANNIDLKFAPDWPSIQHIIAKLVFSGRQMTIDVQQAETLGIQLGELRALIPYFGEDKPSILHVTSKPIATTFSQALRYVHGSPLEDSIGKMFTGTEAKGDVSLLLDLTVPLSDPDKTKVQGELTLKNNDIAFVPWNLELRNVSGDVQFTEDTTQSKEIKAILFDKPVSIHLSTIKKQNNLNVARASFSNEINIADLEKWLKMPFSKIVKGSTNLKGSIDLSTKAPMEITVESNLAGLAIDLPDGYSKEAATSRNFQAVITVEEKQPLRIKANYEKLLSAALLLKRSQDHFKLTGINLRLGGGDPEWPLGEGLYISGNIPLLDWEKIKQYASDSADTKNQRLQDYPLRKIDVWVDQLNLPGQSLTQAHLVLTPDANSWGVNVASSDIVGEIQVPVNFSAESTLVAQFNKLHLKAAKDKNATSNLTVDLKTLPNISLVANNASYDDIPLGKVTLKTITNKDGVAIQTLQINAQHMELQSTGLWTTSGTRLQGKVLSSNVGEFLNDTGMNAHNFIAGKGSIDFDLNWPGAFFAPKLANLNGWLNLKVGAGRVVDVGESSDAKLGVGRLLSIFSLQSIPKRLTLDFSDLFQKGYSFDSLTGYFSLKNGNAYTSNMNFKGTVARIDINGRIGLNNQDLDLTLSVTPGDVTSGIPVAATLLGGPVGGIAALAVNTVVGSQISKAATHYYAVKGPWSNPTWDAIDANSRKTGQ